MACRVSGLEAVVIRQDLQLPVVMVEQESKALMLEAQPFLRPSKAELEADRLA